jgi:hypothetical protein
MRSYTPRPLISPAHLLARDYGRWLSVSLDVGSAVFISLLEVKIQARLLMPDLEQRGLSTRQPSAGRLDQV